MLGIEVIIPLILLDNSRSQAAAGRMKEQPIISKIAAPRIATISEQ